MERLTENLKKGLDFPKNQRYHPGIKIKEKGHCEMEVMSRFAQEQLEKYGRGSLYRPAQSQKLKLAFYYDACEKKKRKVITGETEEELHKNRIAFLESLANGAISQAPAVQPSPTPVSESLLLEKLADLEKAVSKNNRRYKDGTVRDLVEEFLRMRKNDSSLSYSGWEDLRTRGNHLIRFMGNNRISELTHEGLVQFLADFSSSRKGGKPYSEKTLSNQREFLKKVLKYAQSHTYMSRERLDDLTSDLPLPANAAKFDKNKRFVDYGELGRCLALFHKTAEGGSDTARNGTDGMLYYFVLRIMFLTGLRPEELFALEYDCLKPGENLIEVRQALKKTDKGGRKFQIGQTKTACSNRKVPAIDRVFYYFEKLGQVMELNGAREKALELGNGNFVITNIRGELCNLHTLSENLRKLQESRGNHDGYVTFYTMRHCFTTQLDNEDANENDVERALGHVLPDVGNRHYRADTGRFIQRLLPSLEKMEAKLEKSFWTSLDSLEIVEKM